MNYRIVRYKTDSAGETTWKEIDCPYCGLDTAGHHKQNCPNKYGKHSGVKERPHD